jgi:hypothetical protein
MPGVALRRKSAESCGEVGVAVADAQVDVPRDGVAQVDMRDPPRVAPEVLQGILAGGHDVAEVHDDSDAGPGQPLGEQFGTLEVPAEPEEVSDSVQTSTPNRAARSPAWISPAATASRSSSTLRTGSWLRAPQSLAARTLCELPDRIQVTASLRTAIDAMAAAAEGSLEERIESDLEFHRTMCRLTGNETLLHSWESLEGSIRMSIMFAGLERAVSNMSVDRHYDIVTAIESGDASLARQTILEHMDGAAANLVA